MDPNTNKPATSSVTSATLIAWRERMGFKPADACNELGCTRDEWTAWERGTREVPRYIGLACAALALGIDLN